MGKLNTSLLCLLVFVCSTGAGLAQDSKQVVSRNILDLVATLKADVEELKFLSSHIEASGELKQDILLYRRDVHLYSNKDK